MFPGLVSEGGAGQRLGGELGPGREQVPQRRAVAVQVTELDDGVGRSPVQQRRGAGRGVLQERVDELDAAAQRALDAPDAWRALSEWLELDQCATEYPGTSARVGESLSDASPAVGTLCGPMKNSFARLFERARQEVPLRPDLPPTQLLSMVSARPRTPGPAGY